LRMREPRRQRSRSAPASPFQSIADHTQSGRLLVLSRPRR